MKAIEVLPLLVTSFLQKKIIHDVSEETKTKSYLFLETS